MMALTILALAPEMKIDKYVLDTKKKVSKNMSKIALSFHVGTTIFNNCNILFKKTLSTLPFPPF